MALTPALSEVFAAHTMLQLDPVLGDLGYTRIGEGPWHRVVYFGRGRYVLVEMRRGGGGRMVVVRLGMGLPAGLARAATGVTLGRIGGRDAYPVAGIGGVAATLDEVLGDLDRHAGEFLHGGGLPTAASPLGS
jgi:hypothetical protein